MTDLRTLLHESAPAPRRPLDLVELHRRAERLGTRRLLAWLAGLGAVLGLAAPVGIGVLSPADGGDSRLGVGPSGVTTTSTSAAGPGVGVGASTTTTIARPAGSPAGSGRSATPASEGSGAPTPSGDAAGAPGAPGAGGPGEPAPASASSNPDYPAAPSCAVDDAALGPGEQRRCRFTATTDGGASMRTSGPASPSVGARGEVYVTHEGTTTRHEVQYQNVRAGELTTFGCTKFIEPGDLVEVVLTSSMNPADGERTTLGAGEGWACYE